jgi:hypothetical protein
VLFPEGIPLLFVGLLLPGEGMPLLVEEPEEPLDSVAVMPLFIKGPILSLSTEKLSCERVCCGLGGGEGGHSPSPSTLQVGSAPCSPTPGEEFRLTASSIEGVLSLLPRLLSPLSPSPSLLPLSVLTES